MRFVALAFGLSAVAAPLAAQQALTVSPDAAPAQRNAEASASNAAVLTPVVPASALTTPSTSDAGVTVTMPKATVGPTNADARAGIAPRESKQLTMNSAAADRHMGAGQNVALMVVGGAALITGLIVGGDGGTIVAIGGAVVGLYGLYNFVK